MRGPGLSSSAAWSMIGVVMHETSDPKSWSVDEGYPVLYGNGIYWKKNTGVYKKKQVLLEYSFFTAIFENFCLVDLINPLCLAYCVDAIIPNKNFYIV